QSNHQPPKTKAQPATTKTKENSTGKIGERRSEKMREQGNTNRARTEGDDNENRDQMTQKESGKIRRESRGERRSNGERKKLRKE
ncbi:hypothetical protein CCACVL1_20966, partial [Corchorus capsularis]